MTIRKMEPTDFDKILDMMLVFYASDALLVHPEESVLRKTLADAIEAGPYVEGFVFCQEEEPVGYGMIAKSYSTEMGGHCVWIEDIYIQPEFRGQGIGKAFFGWLEQNHPEAARFRLEIEPDNHKAEALYRKMGFDFLDYRQMVAEKGCK